MRLFLAGLLVISSSVDVAAQFAHPRYLEPGSTSGLPLVQANDNTLPAGSMMGDTLDVRLEVKLADWRIEGPDGPGLKVEAIAESGKSPMVPAPLIRTETGMYIRVQVTNELEDSTLVVFGLQTRPSDNQDGLRVEPGKAVTTTFEAGAPGTYFYRIRLGAGFHPFVDERDQLAGAFVIDPAGGAPPDRIFVMNIFSTPIDTSADDGESLEALTINGYSWPFTERQRPAVGDTLRWRVINATSRNHPMHLHGFFYHVLSVGSMLEDDIYAPEDVRSLVTEFMRRGTTMLMQWVPRRPGNWLFHCHLSFHVAPWLRLPMAVEADSVHGHSHMAGLVLGIEVQPGPTDLIEEGDPRYITLYALENPEGSPFRYAFSLDPDFKPDSLHPGVPGPNLELKLHQPTYITVVNRMSKPTGVHWHGLELDAWSDGVPDWSRSDGRVSPVIEPGESFTYKLSLMRPGTFIYHSHLDDIDQLTGGLYGPLLVFDPDDTYNPKVDHVYSVGWRTWDPHSRDDKALNGANTVPAQKASVGETHRIRVINIAPAGNVRVWMTRGDESVPLKALAKDGGELPLSQQVDILYSPKYGVGETADFTFTPSVPGTYTLEIGNRRSPWIQTWEVGPATGSQ